MFELSAENTNVVEHRLAGDTLVFECPDCEWGEVAVTAVLEGPGAPCPDCGSRFELLARRVGDEPGGGGANGEDRRSADAEATDVDPISEDAGEGEGRAGEDAGEGEGRASEDTGEDEGRASEGEGRASEDDGR